jgi:hypothetical protein
MPFIFPKRFLRPRDVLDPAEFNQDKEPVQELFDGELDRHNFNATKLKANIAAHESLITSELFNPAVAETAYYDIQSAEVEVPVIFEPDKAVDSGDTTADGTRNIRRRTPNFVTPDGVSFRNDLLESTYSNYDGYPSIIPNTSDWSAVKNSANSDSMKVTITTGQANLYVNAFVQYVWQGFYEPKPPWKYEGAKVDTSLYSWARVHKDNLARAERDLLNNYGPDSAWQAWPFDSWYNRYIVGYNATLDTFGTGSEGWLTSGGDDTMYPHTGSYQYSYALNEISCSGELKRPHLGGFHHISQGHWPALVQFAIRIDGKIIDETITGKTFSFEESTHGLRVDDSPELASDITGESGTYVFGQRSSGKSMSYTKDKRSRPGQKIRASRASSCGPEVLPVRIGAVIPVSPGTHTVEIVARRLLRKRKKFEYGDFVGVFTRRLHVMSLPIQASLTDSELNQSPVSTKSLQSEDIVDAGSETIAMNLLQGRINSVRPSDLKKRSLPNTHLPSKVKYWTSRSISPPYSIGDHREWISDDVIRSRFPGFKYPTYLDKKTTDNSSWRTNYKATAGSTWTGAGWQKLKQTVDGTKTYLNIVDESGGALNISENEKMIIFADLEIRGIRPEISKELQSKISEMENVGIDIAMHNTISDFISFAQQNKYLDLFALFNIGYRTGTDDDANWIIGSKHAPAVLNSSAWLNRKSHYLAAFEKNQVWKSGAGSNKVNYTAFYKQANKDHRGHATAPNNLGITVPLMLSLDRDDFASDAASAITEIAVFGCTTFPSHWDIREDTNAWGPGKGNREITTDLIIEEDDESLYGTKVNNAWISPYPTRGILSGIEAHIGRCRLTVMKVYK